MIQSWPCAGSSQHVDAHRVDRVGQQAAGAVGWTGWRASIAARPGRRRAAGPGGAAQDLRGIVGEHALVGLPDAQRRLVADPRRELAAAAIAWLCPVALRCRPAFQASRARPAWCRASLSAVNSAWAMAAAPELPAGLPERWCAGWVPLLDRPAPGTPVRAGGAGAGRAARTAAAGRDQPARPAAGNCSARAGARWRPLPDIGAGGGPARPAGRGWSAVARNGWRATGSRRRRSAAARGRPAHHGDNGDRTDRRRGHPQPEGRGPHCCHAGMVPCRAGKSQQRIDLNTVWDPQV